MSNFVVLIETISKVGMPLVLSALVVVFLYMLIFKAPKLIREYLDSRKCNEVEIKDTQKNLQDQLFKQLEIITTVAQQGIEAQKRGNMVIEQNTTAFVTYQKVSEHMITSIIDLKDSADSACNGIVENNKLINTVHMEVVKVGERVRNV